MSKRRFAVHWSALRKTIVRGVVIAALAANPLMTSAEQVVIPDIATSTEMDSNNGWPFITFTRLDGTNYPYPTRWQQVYDGRLFQRVGRPMRITGIAFRADGEYGRNITETISDIGLSLSTTARDEFSLSLLNMNSNLGPDRVDVYPRQSLLVSTTANGVGPNDFAFEIIFDNPFVFDPQAGNLLLEVLNFSRAVIVPPFGNLDAAMTPGFGLGRVWSFQGGAGSFDSNGLVTRFTYDPVPEPTSIVMVISGFCVAVVANRKYRFLTPTQ